MHHSSRIWQVLALLLAAAPVGVKLATWPKGRQHLPDARQEEQGKMLFLHEWTANDPLAKGGDGLGPVFNAASCVTCHEQAGAGGGGGTEHNVTTFTIRGETGGKPREGVVHARAVRFPETLAQVDPQLPAVSQPTLASLLSPANRRPAMRDCGPRLAAPNVHLSQRNTPALFGAKLIDEIPERLIIANERAERLRWGLAGATSEDLPVGRALRLVNGRVGRFGWKGQTASLAEFVQAACANELGLGNPGQAQPRPLGKPDYEPSGLDLTADQCDQLSAFVVALPRPVQRLPDDPAQREQAAAGERLFQTTGCADCHHPRLGSVEGLYSDLLLHRMGEELQGGGSYNEPPLPSPDFSPGDGPAPGEWRTPPLWGVADSAPYLHDGRAETLEQAIEQHGGQGARAARRFKQQAAPERAALVAFLKTLRAPALDAELVRATAGRKVAERHGH